jgi:hypothetical protein
MFKDESFIGSFPRYLFKLRQQFYCLPNIKTYISRFTFDKLYNFSTSGINGKQ